MKMTARDRVLLGVVAVLVLGFGFYKFLLTPQHHKATALQQQIASARTALGRAEQQAAAGHAAEVALRLSTPDWKAALRAVPSAADVPPLLKLLNRSSVAAHVSMTNITFPGATNSAETGSTSSTTGTTGTASGPTVIPVQLTFGGGYQALDRLVRQLDRYVTFSHQHLRDTGPLIGISSINVSTGDSTPSKLTIQLTASIYQRTPVSTSTDNTEGS